MFSDVDIFKISSAMAKHAGHKQALVAQNVANADTPGYAARDLPIFSSQYRGASNNDGVAAQRATRDGHLNGNLLNGAQNAPIVRSSTGAPDGNSVSIEREMGHAVDAKRQHDRALAIYKSALNVLHSTLARS